MKEIQIERAQVEGATRSVWRIGEHTLHGIEQPWRDNLPYHSCIPPGTYALIPWTSPNHGECFAFLGGTVTLHEEDLAPPSITRFLCLTHIANTADEVEGCFGIGTEPAMWNRTPAVKNSRVALGKLKKILGDDPYHIAHIRWAA